MRKRKATAFKDQAIIHAIKSGGYEEEVAIDQLYQKYFPTVERLINTNNGNTAQAHDIFQDTIIIFYEQIKSGKFTLQASIGTYLYAVARNLWLNELKKHKLEHRLTETEEEHIVVDSPMIRVIEEDRQKWVLELMSHLKPDCQDVLRYAIFEKRSMEDIAQLMHLKNEQVARNKKNKCLNYLRNIIQNSSLLSHIVKEIK